MSTSLGISKPSALAKFNSKEKQFVRNKLWIPVFEELHAHLRRDTAKIRYLCLPSPACAFVNQLLKMKLISEDTYVVAIESDPYYHKMILEFFGEKLSRGKYEVFQGQYEDLITARELQGKFPFDVIELDLPEALFSIRPNKESRFLDAIARTYLIQAASSRPFHLITSFKIGGTLPSELRNDYDSLEDYLLREILEKENFGISHPQLTEFIGMGQQRSDFTLWCCLYASTLTLIKKGVSHFEIELVNSPYVHSSKSVGAESRIMSHVLKCTPLPLGRINTNEQEQKQIQFLREAIDKTSKPTIHRLKSS